MERKSKAVWSGTLKEGDGHYSLGSGTLTEQPYTWRYRFENETGQEGSNPEELIAAAHASCFAMQLSAYLGNAGHPAERLEVEATVTLVPGTGITGSHLSLVGQVPGISKDRFMEEAERAKQTCPVSMALGAIDVTLDAQLRN